jgi:hypothetical protein
VDRAVSPEFIDDQSVSPADLDYIMTYLRGLNRRLGGVEALLSNLRRWSSAWTPGERITLLDIATGTADLPLEARRWAERAGFDLRVTAIDVNEGVLDLARRHVCGRPGIELVRCDAGELLSRFRPGSFHYVHSGLFLHHLDDAGAVRVLGIMNLLASRGLIWNDLMRSRRGYAATWLFTLARRRILRHDACASIRAGFTAAEARALGARAGLEGAVYAGNFLTHRFTLVLDKPAPRRWSAHGLLQTGAVGAVAV